MKKSYLIFLLCFVFGCQIFAPKSTSPELCEEESHSKIEIDNIIWDADSIDLVKIIPKDIKEFNLGNLPDTFNIVQVSLTHPLQFKEYAFDISASQSGSSKPVLILFTYYEHHIEITPVNDTQFGNAPTKLNVKIINGNNGGGVVTAAAIDTFGPGNGQKCIEILTKGKTLTLQDGTTCVLNDSSDKFCKEPASEVIRY